MQRPFTTKAAIGQAPLPRPALRIARLAPLCQGRNRTRGVTEPIVDRRNRRAGLADDREGRTPIALVAPLWLRRGVADRAAVLVALPVVLTFLYLPSFVHPVSTLMLKDLATFSGYDRRWVPLDDVAPVLANSVIMSEDGQFCCPSRRRSWRTEACVDRRCAGRRADARRLDDHHADGEEPVSLAAAARLRCARSIELPLAVYFDLVLPKRRIMEIYLNIAEWGPGIYGIEAAAQHHFGRSAQDTDTPAGGAAGRHACPIRSPAIRPSRRPA